MRQRAEVDLGVGLPEDVREQADEQGDAEPHEAHKARGEPAPAQPHGERRCRTAAGAAGAAADPLVARGRRRYLQQGGVQVERVALQPPRPPALVPTMGRGRRERVGLARPPRRREDALRLGQRVAQAEVPLVGHEDDEGDGDGHGHEAEGPRDPGRVVHRDPASLGQQVDGDRGCYRHYAYQGYGDGKP